MLNLRWIGAAAATVALMASPAAANGPDPKFEFGVTAWWVVFNNPDKCTEGAFALCGGGDIGKNPEVDICVSHATGSATRDGGNVTLVATLLQATEEGDGIGTLLDTVPGTPCLTNPEGAEIHFIVRSHDQEAVEPGGPGSIERRIVEAQTTSFGEFNRGLDESDSTLRRDDDPCFLFPQEGDLVAALGARAVGLRVCADVQFAVHPSTDDPSLDKPVRWNGADFLEAAGIDADDAEDLADTVVDGAWSSLFRAENYVTAFIRTSLDH